MKKFFTGAFLLGLIVASGCGGDKPVEPVDTTPADTTVLDEEPVDTAPPADTTVLDEEPVDTAPPADTTVLDEEPVDTQATVQAETYTVDINNYTFGPSEITINVGDSVKWTNFDSVSHSIVSDSFSSENFSTNESFEFKFDTAGTYAYICGLHPSMKGTVIVTE